MPYLLDTDILSALRKKRRDPKLEKWFAANRAADFYLSVVTVGEIQRGISRQQSVDPAFASALSNWLEGLLVHYGGRVLPLTVGIARRWGKLSAELGHHGADLMIAATALEHNLTVITRNTTYFEPTRVAVINPFVGKANNC
ncbi:hypothetical protein MCAMS1_01044 [biofilm metagenome]